MDFKKFESWCKNRGFIITLPSGYIRVNNLNVKSFESFKGLFSLCMLFFQEEIYNQKENENDSLIEFNKENKKRDDTIRSNRTYENSELKSLVDKVAEKCSDPKYSEEDFEKVINYLLTPDAKELVPMDELLDGLENGEKEKKSNWCDLGKETYQRELQNSKSGDFKSGD